LSDGHFVWHNIVDGVYQSNADIASFTTSALGRYAPVLFLSYRDFCGDVELHQQIDGYCNPTPDLFGFYTNLRYKRTFFNVDFRDVYGNEYTVIG